MLERGRGNRYLVLTAMIFAVAMMFIDQTIVAIAVPAIGRGLSLSQLGLQWIINGYLLALAALFALGGKLSDVLGHRRMVLIGVIGFAGASALCGATPSGSAGEAWLIGFRVVQGAFGAIMFPAALAIVVGAFAPGERGKALAIFFGLTGGLTSVGPLAGGFLVQWTWRAIFWINIPIALIAIALILWSDPPDERRASPIDYRGAVLVSGGMALAVLGLQQASRWGWGSAATWGSLIAGCVLLVVFAVFELRIPDPLIEMRIFANRGFLIDNIVLFLLCLCFVPLFFFASVYAQVSLQESASATGLYLGIFFLGFVLGSQVGGRILDRRGVRRPAVLGSALTAVGFVLWAHQLSKLSLSTQWYWIVMTGAGMGLVLSPTSTDAINRAPRGSYGEVTGVTQTVRYFASSLGLAVLGTILIAQNKINVAASLAVIGVPRGQSDRIAASLTSVGASGGRSPAPPKILISLEHAFAQSSRTVFLVMAGVMALSFVIALALMRDHAPDSLP